jgi:hypothetical protein
MGMSLVQVPDVARLRGQSYGFHEDFLQFVTGDLFTDTSADSGAAVANVDAAGGTVTLTTGATDNNECYLLSTKELFLVAAGKSLFAEARLKYSEANTDDANVFFGFMNAVAADSILDNGAGPKSSYSGALFYKVDGGTNWKVQSSITTTRTGDTELTAANSLDKTVHVAGSTAYQILRIDITPKSSTKADVEFSIDGVLVYKITDWTYTSATEMNVFVGVKAGDTNSEVVTVDYLTAFQKR